VCVNLQAYKGVFLCVLDSVLLQKKQLFNDFLTGILCTDP